MVSVRLYGRFANQLMQYCCCIAYSLKYDVPYCIPSSTLNNSVWKPYQLGSVNYCNDINGATTVTMYSEKSHSYTEIPEIKANKVVLDGYWQSELYFKEYISEIRKIIGFDYSVKYYKTVCIHVRRGDYLNYPDKHPVITIEYIVKSIDLLNSKVPYRLKYIIFSDDMQWCKESLLGFNKVFDEVLSEGSIIFSENKDELEDFQLMLNCEHFIISNSTYSLMAAILSESKSKICISPSKENWFGSGNAHLDTSTIIPENFIQIKY